MICSYAFLLIFNKNTLNTHYIWRGRIPLLQIESRKHVYWTWKRTQCYLFNSVCGNLNPQAQPRPQGAFPWLFLPPHLQRQGKAPWGRGCPRPRMFKRRIACASVRYLPRTQTSLFWWKCARKGRREGDNGPFPCSLAVHHQSLVSRSPLPCAKTKRLRRRLVRYYIHRINHYASGRFIQWIALSTFWTTRARSPSDNIQLFLQAQCYKNKQKPESARRSLTTTWRRKQNGEKRTSDSFWT